MRAHIPSYDVVVPQSLAEALELLEKENALRPLAGGTDLMVLLEAGVLKPGRFLSLWSLSELKGIEESQDEIKIGALTTYAEIQENTICKTEFPQLCEAARVTGAKAIQNRGTLGGNIINASPAADSLPALLVYEARVCLASQGGERWVDYKDFHQDYKKMDLKAGELLTQIALPRKFKEWQSYYRKVGTRCAQAISKVCFSGIAQVKDNIIQEAHMAMGAVAPVPLRCFKTEEFLKGKTLEASIYFQAHSVLLDEITPISDIRASKEYREVVSKNLLSEFLEGLA